MEPDIHRSDICRLRLYLGVTWLAIHDVTDVPLGYGLKPSDIVWTTEDGGSNYNIGQAPPAADFGVDVTIQNFQWLASSADSDNGMLIVVEVYSLRRTRRSAREHQGAPRSLRKLYQLIARVADLASGSDFRP